MKNAEQLIFRELDPTELANANGGFIDPLELLGYLADVVIDMINDPDCQCGGEVVYYP